MILVTARYQVKSTISNPFAIVGWVVTPLILLCLLTVPRVGFHSSTEDASIVTAVTLASFWSACVWSSLVVLRRERQNGTLASSLTAVADSRIVLTGKMLGGCVSSLIGVSISVSIFTPILDLRPSFVHPTATMLGFLVAILTGIAASFIFGSLLVVSRFGDHISTALGMPMMLLGGTLLPSDALPPILSLVPHIISLSWIQKWNQSSASSQLDYHSLIIAIALTVAYALIGVLLLKRVIAQARQQATLELR